jgi:hypothetical protein
VGVTERTLARDPVIFWDLLRKVVDYVRDDRLGRPAVGGDGRELIEGIAVRLDLLRLPEV